MRVERGRTRQARARDQDALNGIERDVVRVKRAGRGAAHRALPVAERTVRSRRRLLWRLELRRAV